MKADGRNVRQTRSVFTFFNIYKIWKIIYFMGTDDNYLCVLCIL